MLGVELERTLRRSLALANARQHEYATIEHLLLALLDDPDASEALVGCGANLEQLRRQLTDFIDHELSPLTVDGSVNAQPTAGFQRIILRAAIHVQSAGKSEVNGANVLVALFSERESHAVFFLQEQKLSRIAVVQYLMSPEDREHKQALRIPSVHDLVEAIIRDAKKGIVLVADTLGQEATLEEISDTLEVVRLDVNWSWRVSETLYRIIAPGPVPYWAGQTVEQLKRWASTPEEAGYVSLYLNTVEFDPLEETLLERPLVRFIKASHHNPIELTIAVSAASLTIVVMACLWGLRTWKKIKIDEEFVEAKSELIKRISTQIVFESPSQLKEIEGSLLGLLNSPNGLHEKGDEVSISVPHLLSARVATEGRGSIDRN